MFLSGKDPDDLIRTMNEEMVKVIDWLQINRLSLNLNKTHFILFRRKRVRISLSTDLIINNVKIDMIERTKFLGVMIDQNMSFQSHINYIKGKVARGIGILYKSKPYFSFETMRVLYNAFIYPYFTYCIEVWCNTYQSYLEPLIKLQKRAVRTVVGARKYAHTAPLFKELKLLNIKEIYIYCVQLLMYKHHHSILPSIFMYEIIQFMNIIPGNRIFFMCHWYSQNHCQKQLEYLEWHSTIILAIVYVWKYHM